MSEVATAGRTDEEREGVRAVQLRIPARAEYVSLCRLALAGVAQLRALSEEAVTELKLALTDAVSNVVRHADGDGHVDVRYELAADRLHIDVGAGASQLRLSRRLDAS